jgi:putative salt-induced outer membrane protein YdiY
MTESDPTMHHPLRRILVALLPLFLASIVARGDEVLFKDGDRLTGKIQSYDGSKLILKTASAGTVSVELKNVRTFSSDGPIEVVLQDGTVLHERISQGPDGQVHLAGEADHPEQAVPFARIKSINSPQKWSGNVVVGGLLARGNTDADTFNASAHLVRRGVKDRLTLDAGYIFGRERVSGLGTHETQNNWFTEGKYDYFFQPKLYAYADARAERDVIANIDLRLTPNAGVGYQWVETPRLAFNTEAGAGWLYRSYSHDGSDSAATLRAAYHLTAKVNDKVGLFHDLEYFPGIDRIDNYFVLTDAGVNAKLTEQFFIQFKIEYRYDSQPAPNTGRSDLRYILGVGWNF